MEEKKRYSNQQSNSTFQPQTYRQSSFEQVNPGRTETHSSSAPTLSSSQQPLVGVIDQGFGAGEHGAEVLKTIAQSNSQSPAWLGGGVGNGCWAESLTKFVDAAKTLGQRAVANLSFDLTEKHSDGSVTTRSQLTTAEQQALSYAHDNGVLIVASSGNQGNAMSALGQASQQFDNIIAVGAAEGNHRADYSSYGNGLDLVALGQQAGDAFTGTSRSAAEVTGTISQMWAANSTLDYRQVTGALESTATDLQKAGWDAETGAGLLNSTAAINLAKTITPETQQFSGAQLIQQVNGSFNTSPWTSTDGTVASERTTRLIEGTGSAADDDRSKATKRYAKQRAENEQITRDAKASKADREEASWILKHKGYISAPVKPAHPPARDVIPKPPANREKPPKNTNRAGAVKHPVKPGSAQDKAALKDLIGKAGTSTADRNEALAILHAQEAKERAAAEKKRLAQEKAALKKQINNPRTSTADRNEASNILHALEAQEVAAAEKQFSTQGEAALTQKAHDSHASPAEREAASSLLRKREAAKTQAAKPPAPKKKGWLDRTVDNVKEDLHDAGDFVKRNADVISEVGHTALDVAGMVPVIGAVADGVNAGWYAAAGDYTNAGLSLAGMVPGVGDAAIAGKLAMKGAKLATKAEKAINVGQKAVHQVGRAYEAYGTVQDAQGVVDGTADAIDQFSHGDYLHGGLSVVNAGLSAFGVHGGVKGAGGGGNHHDPSPGSDRTSPASDRVSAPDKGNHQIPSSEVGTAGAGNKRDPLEPRVVRPADGSKRKPGVKHGSPVVAGGRKEGQTRPSDGRPSDRSDPTRPFSPSKKDNHEPAPVGAGKDHKSDLGDNAIKPPTAKAQDHGATHPGVDGSGDRNSPQPSIAASPHPSRSTQTSPNGSSHAPRTGGGGSGNQPPQKPPTGGSPSSFNFESDNPNQPSASGDNSRNPSSELEDSSHASELEQPNSSNNNRAPQVGDPVPGLTNARFGKPRGGGGRPQDQAYDRLVTGSDLSVYVRNSSGKLVEFDGVTGPISDRTLLDGKNVKPGSGGGPHVKQARRQLDALQNSGASGIEWRFSDLKAAIRRQRRFNREEMDITCVSGPHSLEELDSMPWTPTNTPHNNS